MKFKNYKRFILVVVFSLLSFNLFADAPDAPEKFAKPYPLADFSQVNETVTDLTSLRQLFEYLRDERFLTWDKMPAFSRRIPWLYTQNGCSDRATLMRQLIEKRNLTVPTRAFAFAATGKRLIVRSPFWTAPITWGEYHTALVTKVDGNIYVLDPVAEPTRPLLMSEWASRLGDGHPEEVSIAICNPLSSSAERSCWEKDTNQAYRILFTQGLLEKEWDAVSTLKPEYSHDPNVVLGDTPPWKFLPVEHGSNNE